MNKLGDINFTDYCSDDDDIVFNNDKDYKKKIIESKEDDLFSDEHVISINDKFILNNYDETFSDAQYKFNQLEIKKKYDILESIAKVYKSMYNLLIWYKNVLLKIETELDEFTVDSNKNNLISSTNTISNMIKVLFIKNYDIHSLFIINQDEELKKGYYISQNYNKMLTTNKNLDIKFYYIDSIKFYEIKNSVFKFSLINEDMKEYIIKIGHNYSEGKTNYELYEIINKIYCNIEKYKDFLELNIQMQLQL